MTFIVVWKKSAETRLAHIWSTAGDRNVVTAAADRIDRQLWVYPEDLGESRPPDRRIMFAPPLVVVIKFSPRIGSSRS